MRNFIAKQFRQPSGFFGKLASLAMRKNNVCIYEKMIPKMRLTPRLTVLEIGYGHGIGIDRICSGFDCCVTGIDFSRVMYREAVKRNKRHLELKKAVVTCGDYLEARYDAASFDRIFCINVIYFWKVLETPFAKMFCELKNGGMLFIYMAHAEDLRKMKFTTDDVFNKYPIDQVVAALESAGFIDVHHEMERGYFIYCKK